MADKLEPAIPPHLTVDRTVPRRGEKIPTHPSYSSRFPEDVTFFACVILGIQSRPVVDTSQAMQLFKHGIANEFGPQFHDVGRSNDLQGYENVLFSLYWTDEERFDKWNEVMGDGWWHGGLDLNGDVGVFKKTLRFTPWDFETTFTHQYPEGLSKLEDHMSGLTDSHEYWGSFIDRIPRGQYDELLPNGQPHLRSGGPLPDDTRGHLLEVVPNDNMLIIRSGQDWIDTAGEERAFYLEKLQPVLAAGMQSIAIPSGVDAGCYFNDYPVTILDDDGQEMEKTFSLSMWHSAEKIDRWTRASKEHLEIFRAGIAHYRNAGENANLRLYHELYVVKAEGVSFKYFNCHKDTGMLRAVQGR
ncbi:heme-containing dehydratase protein [Mycena capillaripes]|nr:heme-containing dehydratase protein [Mycena capillaripes]